MGHDRICTGLSYWFHNDFHNLFPLKFKVGSVHSSNYLGATICINNMSIMASKLKYLHHHETTGVPINKFLKYVSDNSIWGHLQHLWLVSQFPIPFFEMIIFSENLYLEANSEICFWFWDRLHNALKRYDDVSYQLGASKGYVNPWSVLHAWAHSSQNLACITMSYVCCVGG